MTISKAGSQIPICTRSSSPKIIVSQMLVQPGKYIILYFIAVGLVQQFVVRSRVYFERNISHAQRFVTFHKRPYRSCVLSRHWIQFTGNHMNWQLLGDASFVFWLPAFPHCPKHVKHKPTRKGEATPRVVNIFLHFSFIPCKPIELLESTRTSWTLVFLPGLCLKLRNDRVQVCARSKRPAEHNALESTARLLDVMLRY